jgi:CRP-like cAMP-binding protein
MTHSLQENPKGDILPLISGDHQYLKDFFEIGRKEILKKGNIIINQGDMVDRIYLINKGKLKITLLTESGEEKLFWYAYPQTIFGEVPFFCKLPCNGTIIAEEDSEISSHDYESFFKILYKNPKVTEFFLTTMAKKIQILTGQVKDISCSSPYTRINKLLYSLTRQFGKSTKKGIELNLTITHKEIAFITGLHRVTVTNVMNKLKKEGIIDIPKRGKLIIIDFNKLLTNTFNTDI